MVKKINNKKNNNNNHKKNSSKKKTISYLKATSSYKFTKLKTYL